MDHLARGLFERAQAHHQAGRLQEAALAYHQVLSLTPDHAPGHHMMGVLARQAGQTDIAVAQIRKAIALAPTEFQYRLDLLDLLRAHGRPEEAMACLQDMLGAFPDRAETFVLLGRALREQGQLESAAQCFARAVELASKQAPIHAEHGHVLWRLGRRAEAIAALREAVRLQPDDALAQCNLGLVLDDAGDTAAAEACFREALLRAPQMVEAHVNLGLAVGRQGRIAEAEEAFRAALALAPDHPVIHNNLGFTLRALGRLDEAEAASREAIRGAPDFAEAHHALAVTLLLGGRLREGWDEYEWRWRLPAMPPRDFAAPAWDGTPVGGRVVLLHAEQGFGDTIQFCRFIPRAAGRARIILEVPAALAELLRGLEGVSEVVVQGQDPPPFDLHCPLMSLPRVLGVDSVQTIPARMPYLIADPYRAEAWRQRLSAIPGRKMGIAWAGNPTYPGDVTRSLAPALLAPLAAVPDVALISLQKINGAAAPASLGLHDWTSELHDFADTAALIAGLDLVISVDTSVVHLAGALGKPVWLLNRFDTCWRWLLGRDDSPWYPTLRQFRQTAPGDWAEPIARAAAALHEGAISPA